MMFYTITVRDKNGKLLSRERRKSRSYVKQWIVAHSVNADMTDAPIVDITGATVTLDATYPAFDMTGPAGSDDYGVVIGTGNTAVTISDYALETQIVEGTGSGQMSHLACAIGAATVDGSSCYFTITRIINNSSGATITVKEIGLYVLGYEASPGLLYFLGVRDVLASPQAVPDGGAITVVYTLKVTV